MHFPLSRTLQFRDANLEVIRLVNGPADFDGVIVDNRGDVLALWSSFAYESGRELEQRTWACRRASSRRCSNTRATAAPCTPPKRSSSLLSLAEARRLGLDEQWIERLSTHNPQNRQVLSVERLVAGSPAAGLLQPGDLLLAVDGKWSTASPTSARRYGRRRSR